MNSATQKYIKTGTQSETVHNNKKAVQQPTALNSKFPKVKLTINEITGNVCFTYLPQIAA